MNLTVLSHPNENQLRTESHQRDSVQQMGLSQIANMTDSEIESMGVDEDDAFGFGMSMDPGIDRLVGPMAGNKSTTVRGRLGVAVQPFVLIGIPIGFEGQMTLQEMEFIEADGWLDILGTTVLMAIITLLFWFI